MGSPEIYNNLMQTDASQETQIVDASGTSAKVEARKQTPTGNALNVQIGPGDVISNIPVVMDFPHHQVHEGESHSVEYYSENPASINFAITVPVYSPTIGSPHLIMEMQSYGGAGQISIWEGATYTNGTPMTIFNRNRNSLIVPKAGMSVISGVTSNDGTRLPYTAIVGASEKTTASNRAIDEIDLKSNTTYVVRYEELTATTRLVIRFEWYEDLGV
jgi:hypothetical protein